MNPFIKNKIASMPNDSARERALSSNVGRDETVKIFFLAKDFFLLAFSPFRVIVVITVIIIDIVVVVVCSN